MEENVGNWAEGAIGAFLDSCYKGDQSAIAALLEKGADVNGSDAVFTTPLQVAAASGHETLVQLLVQRGARLEAANLYGWTPLMQAARHGHAGVVRLLLLRGADVSRCNRLGASPLMLAAVSGHLSTVSALLEAGAGEPPPAAAKAAKPAPARAPKAAKKTAAAAGRGAEREEGVPAAAASPRRRPAQSPASALCPTAASPRQRPPQCPASALGPTAAATLAAAAHGNNSVLRLLLDRGASLDTQLPDIGLTALMLAAVGGHRSTCRILLERGADPNAHSTLGHTALDMARLAGHRQVVRVLEERTEEADDTGDGCDLHEAVRRRDLQLAAQLLAAGGGTADKLRPDGGAPLMLAALAGDTQMAALLLRHGAAVNLQDPTTGWTALMQAVFHNHLEMVKLLLSSSADANLRDHKGCTAFDLASLVDSSPDMIRLLAACTYKFTPPVAPAGLAGGPAPLAWQSRAVSTPSLQDRGLKAWWSRLSSRFQNVKSRVEPVVMTAARAIPEESVGGPPKLTLDSILPPAKRVKARMPQGFPARSLPSDTLRPVLPPFCTDRRTEDRCCLPPALSTGAGHCDDTPDSAAAPGGHLNTYRLLSYLRSPNSSPSNSLGQRRLLSPGPHSSGDSGFETSGKSSAGHPYFSKAANKAVSPVKRGSNKNNQKPAKKPSGSSGDPPAAGSDCQAVGKLTYLLRSLGLARYGPAFVAQEIDFEAFLDLTDADLVELEVSRRDRQKLALVIGELRQKLRV